MLKLLLLISLIGGGLYYYLHRGPVYELTPETAVFTPLQKIPEGLTSIRAESCGVCHQEIYDEWKTSLHAGAYRDPLFLAYYRKDDLDPSCLVCHTPLQNQLEETVSYQNDQYDRPISRKNPDFDAVLRDEGVTCAACHLRGGVILGPYSKDQLPDSPHPVRYDPSFKSSTFCLGCHQVPSRPASWTRQGICSTGEEYAASFWAKQGTVCQDCHMEQVSRSLVEGFPERVVGRHTWPGGYVTSQLKKAFSFDASYEANRESIVVTITNSGAGHKVPTGDPDRSVDLEFLWESADGRRGTVKTVTFKRVVMWQPVIIDLTDNRLAPGESLTFRFTPEGSRSDAGRLLVKGVYHVMTDEALERLKKHHGLTEHQEIHRPFMEMEIILHPVDNVDP